MEVYFDKLNYNLNILIAKLSNNSNPLLDFVDKIFYINLEHRKDRKQQIENELRKIDPYFKKTERFNACTYNNDNIPKNIRGAIGCSTSHMEIIKIAKKNNYNNILILEDDFLFNIDIKIFFDLITTFHQNIKDFHFLILGTNQFNFYKTNINDIYKISGSQTTSGYIINKNIFDQYIKIIDNSIKELINTRHISKYAIDMVWKQLQGKDKKCYTFNNKNRKVGIQRESYSDIECRNVNYKT